MSITKHNIKAKSHILTLLGEELIGNDGLAIFELVKNSYDADATEIKVTFVDLNTPNQKIIKLNINEVLHMVKHVIYCPFSDLSLLL